MISLTDYEWSLNYAASDPLSEVTILVLLTSSSPSLYIYGYENTAKSFLRLARSSMLSWPCYYYSIDSSPISRIFYSLSAFRYLFSTKSILSGSSPSFGAWIFYWLFDYYFYVSWSFKLSSLLTLTIPSTSSLMFSWLPIFDGLSLSIVSFSKVG